MKKFLLKNKPGDRMAIVVAESDPNLGVLVLMERKEKIGPFVIMKAGGKIAHLPIIRLEMYPELCGIDEPFLPEPEKEIWTKPYRQIFCESLQEAIEESGIRYLGIAEVEGGEKWARSPYARLIKGVVIKDIQDNLNLN